MRRMWREAAWFGSLLVALAWGRTSRAQELDDTWTVSVGGQSVTVNPNGTFRIPNILSPDNFGPGGPGTRPDFLSDDFLRVLGTKTVDGETLWAFSQPFQIRQGQRFHVPALTITPVAPPLPQSLRIEADRTLLAVGEATTLRVIGTLLNGDVLDVTRRDFWTTYRTSNTGILTIGPNGELEAVGVGTAIITALNEGAAASKRFQVAAELFLTTVEGRVLFEGGAPAEGATVSVGESTGITNSKGVFQIPSVLAGTTLMAAAVLEVGNQSFSGSSNVTLTIPDGNTDVGDIVLHDAVFESDYGTNLFLSDDDFSLVGIGFSFPFYGTEYTGVYVGSNGYLTFNQGDSEFVESIPAHLGPLPRISAFFDDLDPRITPGGVFFNTLTGPNRLVVTWDRLPEYPAGFNPPANTIQAILFESGRIQFGYAGVVSPDALVGLSPGGSPPYSATDYSLLTGSPLTVPAGRAVLELFGFISLFDLDGGFVIFDPLPGGGYSVRFLPGVQPSSVGTVRGRLRGSDGEPLARTPIVILSSRGGSSLSAMTDARGYYEVRDVPFGGVVHACSSAYPMIHAARVAPAGAPVCDLDVSAVRVPAKHSARR